MKRTFVLLVIVSVFAAMVASAALPPQANPPKFPSLPDQLKSAHAKPGSALEKLIRDNQDFSKLKPRDAVDPFVPPWLKVYWQKGHPEVN